MCTALVLEKHPPVPHADVPFSENGDRHLRVDAAVHELIQGKHHGHGHPDHQQPDQQPAQPVLPTGILPHPSVKQGFGIDCGGWAASRGTGRDRAAGGDVRLFRWAPRVSEVGSRIGVKDSAVPCGDVSDRGPCQKNSSRSGGRLMETRLSLVIPRRSSFSAARSTTTSGAAAPGSWPWNRS